MGIDKTGKHDTAAQVDALGRASRPGSRDTVLWTRQLDRGAADQHGAVANQPHVAHLPAASRTNGSPERQELAAIDQQERSRSDRLQDASLRQAELPESSGRRYRKDVPEPSQGEARRCC